MYAMRLPSGDHRPIWPLSARRTCPVPSALATWSSPGKPSNRIFLPSGDQTGLKLGKSVAGQAGSRLTHRHAS